MAVDEGKQNDVRGVPRKSKPTENVGACLFVAGASERDLRQVCGYKRFRYS